MKIVPAAPKCLPNGATFYVKVPGGPTNAHEYISCSRKPITTIADREAVKEAWKFNEYEIAALKTALINYNANTRWL